MLILVYLLKFIHVLLALSLLGTAIYCIIAVGLKKKCNVRLNKTLLVLSFFALMTGSLLVIPKHYTFVTPWIQAAYVLVLSFGAIISTLLLKKQSWLNHPACSCLVYLMLTVLLVVIIHDAVTKSTFLL